MLQHHPRNIYAQNSVNTASPAQLLLMLYDGAIRFTRSGIEDIKNKRYQQASTHLCKAQAIINEFIITLDKSADIAQSLLSLYNYMNRRLTEANVKKNTEPAEEVLGYLTELRETWAEAARKVAAASAGALRG
ncbi:flagellar export chaperone FliS [Paenibacillus thermoaerophilus]|uniref:Flagellar secretion chaperone FliS n=1 Tax=Paenibacillus thermoaerophilus TaxID=1215385 RepID=A0ABW2V5N0_9BACL|nr:flagellar export chaperone FliS [Paenibacillus thermoaerophilus]TMV09216.1 flagellar export chaperone FliS [Paenibacillus thermoaerophilus]